MANVESTTQSLFKRTKGIAVNISPITTLGEFVEYIRVLTDEWDVANPWFRGVSKANYLLSPRIYRESIWHYNRKRAREIVDEFIRRAQAIRVGEPRQLSRWDWYQIMQHHGVPTRLLDWTQSSNAALFFALRHPDSVKTACVWVLDPHWLNKVSTGSSVAFYTDQTIQSPDDAITSSYLEHTDQLPELPIAIYPAHANPRIAAQRGCFTVHGRNADGLAVAARRSHAIRLAQIRIDDSHTLEIRDELSMFGMTETMLFPDLDGLARELCQEYGFQV